MNIFINPEEEKLRLDKLLTLRFPEYSRAYFQYLIENGAVLMNGKQIKKREKGTEGDEIEIFFLHSPEITLKPQDIPLKILYEDEDIIAIDKPAGMVVHPGPGHIENTFVNALLYHLKSHDFDDHLRPGIVHRLDKETSGILLAAKNLKSHAKLVKDFSERKIQKCYLAICYNRPCEGRVDIPIGRHPKNRKKMTTLIDGKPAQTDVEIIAAGKSMSLVSAKPITGRTHQIRVHLKYLNAPILGDHLYGKGGAERHMLHAYKLIFNHPFSNKKISLTAPLPKDFLDHMEKNFDLKGSIAF